MDKDKPKILAVDDRPENLFVLEKILRDLDVELVLTLTGPEALRLSLEHDFCVAIVDIQMPDMDGYELVELLRSNTSTSTLPVIFVSAIYSDEYHHRKAYEAGAIDFLSKPFIPEILVSKVKIFIELYQQRRGLEQVNAALRQANADKDKFFSIISHDLRAPFNTILGNAQLLDLKLSLFSPEDTQSMIHSIYQGARSAYNLLDNLLTWSRLQREGGMKVCREPLRLEDIAKEAVDLMATTAAAKDIRLTTSIAPDTWVFADRCMLETVLRNLIGNAIKFTPRNGSISVEPVPTTAHSGPVTLAVRDTGIGMSPEVLDRLFRVEAHLSTLGTEQEPGSGLGLMICQEMVERNGGRIWAESEPNRGTTIKFTVPHSG